jgi:ricin-type beta-trefoil lectin protein
LTGSFILRQRRLVQTRTSDPLEQGALIAMRTPKRMIMTLAGLLMAAGGALATAPPAGAVVPGVQVVAIRGLGSGKCIAPVAGPDGVITYAGLPIQQFTCDNQNRTQTWILWYVGHTTVTNLDVYHVINQGTGLCLDDRDGKTSDWSPVQQWTCNDTSSTMLWALGDFQNGAQQLINLRAVQNGGSRCLDVAHGSVQDGAALQLYHCMDGDDAQHFFLS